MRRHDVVVLIFFKYVSRVALEPIGDAEGCAVMSIIMTIGDAEDAR